MPATAQWRQTRCRQLPSPMRRHTWLSGGVGPLMDLGAGPLMHGTTAIAPTTTGASCALPPPVHIVPILVTPLRASRLSPSCRPTRALSALPFDPRGGFGFLRAGEPLQRGRVSRRRVSDARDSRSSSRSHFSQDQSRTRQRCDRAQVLSSPVGHLRHQQTFSDSQ